MDLQGQRGEHKCSKNFEVFGARIKCYDDEEEKEDKEDKEDKEASSEEDNSKENRRRGLRLLLSSSSSSSFDHLYHSKMNNERINLLNPPYDSRDSDLNIGESHRRLGAKVDVVYSLLGMLGNKEDKEDMSTTFLAMSSSTDSCHIMRQSGCLPLLIDLIHAPGQDSETRERASRALHNIIHVRSDEKIGRREVRVLRLLEQVRDYCHFLRVCLNSERRPLDDLERHPGPTIAALMKLSFDEAHRHAMCQLGGLHAVAELIEMDHASHGSDSDDQSCITLRRYAGMALTNLTFGDGNNKALLCSFKPFMKALVSQLSSKNDDLRQVTASLLRNLSWRADSSSKQTLRQVGAVVGLMKAAMEGKKESTLKSILSALWNLSAHCSTNKVDICAVDGALAFLVDMLSYKAPSKTLSIIENAGGILRNISSHIAVREDYRKIVRERGCLHILLRQLRSPSLTVVSNACGALWNLSARCPHDQKLLWDLGAVPMLRSLVHSKHKMISMGSSAALKNLLSARPGGNSFVHLDSTAKDLGLPTLPTLNARRQRAFEQELDPNLSETCENIEPSTSPISKDDKLYSHFKFETNYPDYSMKNVNYQTQSLTKLLPTRSDSRESMRSLTSTHSDTLLEKINRQIMNGFHLNEDFPRKLQSPPPIPPPPTSNSDDELKIVTTSTISWSLTASDQLSTCSFIKSPVTQEKLFIAKSPPVEKPKEENDPDCFGVYTETDLDDKPTNYSLRYAERNSDEQDVEDTVKTYYTEGTPRESSLNSSRAASHSDLQDVIKVKLLSDKIKHHNNINVDSNVLLKSKLQSKHEEKLQELKNKSLREDNEKKEKKLVDKNYLIVNGSNESIPSDGDDDDEDLLAACIHIGMQNNRHRQRRNSLEKPPLNETKLTRYQTSLALDQVDNLSQPEDSDESKPTEESLNEPPEDKDFTSIERSEQVLLEMCIKPKEAQKEENPSPETKINECGTNSYDEYKRQRDPDAMIASLDRLTATLVQQTEAMRGKEAAGMKQSLHSEDWSEDSPVNDSSFPTISISAPLVTSFKSENVNNLQEEAEDLREEEEEVDEESDKEFFTMTTSKLIEEEAFKLADAIFNTSSDSSMSNADLDSIKPPNSINSLVSLNNSFVKSESETYNRNGKSSTGCFNGINSPGVTIARKNSIPLGVVAKRALVAHTFNQTGSLENLLNNVSIKNVSQLENVKPPSMMDELSDQDDLENSMLSVASITEEIVDPKHQNPESISNIFILMKNNNDSLSNNSCDYLENINPPSLFNEISQIDDTTVDFNTEDTICSDTLCIENELSKEEELNLQANSPDLITTIEHDVDKDDDDEEEEGNEIEDDSPVELSSRKRFRNNLTPKEKRQLVKERNKTYTIVELVNKDLEVQANVDNKLQENVETKSPMKITPRQRRRENRERFQTQIVDNPLTKHLPEQSDVLLNSTTACKSNIPIMKHFGSKPGDRKEVEVDERMNIECEKTLTREETVLIDQDENWIDVDEFQNDESQEEENDDEEDEEKEEVKRPRIIKPQNPDANVETINNNVKAIRGKRKSLYSNVKKPTSFVNNSSHSTLNNSRSKQVTNNLINKEQQRSSINSRTSIAKNTSAILSKRSSIPQKNVGNSKTMKRFSAPVNQSPVEPPKPLERQGTFTKDEIKPETNTNNKSKIAKLVPNSPSRRSSGLKGKSGIQSPQKSVSSEVLSPKLTSTFTKRPGSVDNPQNISVKSKSAVNLGQRSASTLSTNSAISQLNLSKETGKKVKEATSKIATLWKKVEMNKNKAPDRSEHKWIKTAPATVESKLPNGLFRSSTFEGVTKEQSRSEDEPEVTTDRQDEETANLDVKSPVKKEKLMKQFSVPPYKANGDVAADAPCKIPIRFLDKKNKGKTSPSIGYQTITLKKQKSNVPDPDSPSSKRLSRLGSFINPSQSSTFNQLNQDNTSKQSVN